MPDDREPDDQASVARGDLETVEGTLDGSGLRGATDARFTQGTRVGRYVVLRELGAGGMGVVYVAFDPELDRRVALKLLHDRQGHERLLREAQAMAKLSHPNVITVHDVGEHAGQIYVAMEFVEGITLRQWCAKEAPPWAEVLGVFVHAGRGLAAAHARKIVHRDFKPENVIVGDDGRVRVLDFGLARQAQGEPPDPDRLVTAKGEPRALATKGSAIAGTPAYMAPEQHASTEVGTPADQFAFCVALWEALYGRRPFAGERYAELAMHVLEGEIVEPPSSRVPGWVRKALTRGLAVDPEARWPSMELLLAELGRASSRLRARRGLLAGGVMVGLLAGAAGYGRLHERARHAQCVSEAKVITETWNAERKRRIEERFVASGFAYAPRAFETTATWLDTWAASWTEASEASCLASPRVAPGDEDPRRQRALECLRERRVVFEALVDRLEDADEPTIRSSTGAAAGLPAVEACRDARSLDLRPALSAADLERLQEPQRLIASARGLLLVGRLEEGTEVAREALRSAESLDHPLLVARARGTLGRILSALGKTDEATEVLAQAYVDGSLVGDPEVAGAAAVELMVVTGLEGGRPSEGMAWAKVAEVSVRAAEIEEGLLTAQWRDNLASLLLVEGKLAEAEVHARTALAVMEDALGENHPRVAKALVRLSVTLERQRRHPEAIELNRRAYDISRNALGDSHPDLAGTLNGLAVAYEGMGAYDEALDAHLEALAIVERGLGPNHQRVGTVLNNLAVLYQSTGEYEKAKAALEKAISIWEETLGAEHTNVASALNNLANLHRQLGNDDEAKKMIERALAIREQSLGPHHVVTARTRLNLGVFYLSTGKPEKGTEILEATLVDLEKVLGPDHPTIGVVVFNLAYAHYLAEELDEAKAMYERALEIDEARLGPDNPSVAHTLNGLARVALKQGDPVRALELCERALTLREGAKVPPEDLAFSRFTMARALWDVPVDKGRDRDRADTLVRQALEGFRVHTGNEDEIADAEKWMKERGLEP